MTAIAIALVVVGLVLIMLGLEYHHRRPGAAPFAVLLGGCIALIAGAEVLFG